MLPPSGRSIGDSARPRPAGIVEQLKTGHRRAFVFVGAAGAGKSELAVNLAFGLARAGLPVRFFDLDQTKPLFRSRELARPMRTAGIEVGGDHQMLDARTIPHGLLDGLRDPSRHVVLDIGGDAQGAVMLGQFASAWAADLAAFLVINPHRAEPGEAEHLPWRIEAIRCAARLPELQVIANPNFGAETTAEDVVAGYRHVAGELAATGLSIEAVGVLSPLVEATRRSLPDAKLLPITRYIVPTWEREEY